MTQPSQDGSTVMSDAFFRCPICGEQGDEVTINYEAEVIYSQAHVPVWEGGPLVTDYQEPPEPHVVDSILTTSVCEHSFRRSLWNIRVTQYPNGSAELQISERYPVTP